MFFKLFFLIFVGVSLGILYWMLKKVTRRDEVWRSLNLRLLSVKLPKEHPKDEEPLEKIREKIAVMENIYSHLLSIHDSLWNSFSYGRPSFALEIAVPHVGEEISFFVAVPKKFTEAAEKIIHANYPSASVVYVRDYNIFNPEGVSLASDITLERNFVFPLKTFKEMPVDPLRIITNAFSKLEKVGEGAAFQIVARPASGGLKQKIHSFSHTVQEGNLDIKSGPETGSFRVIKELTDLFISASAKKKEEEKPKKKMTAQEEELLKKIEGKAGKPLFEVNLRLAVSAGTDKRAKEILQSLESAFGQFADSSANSLKINRLNGKAAKDAIYHFSFRAFDDAKEIILNADELTSLFHFPNTAMETPKLEFLKAREAAPPANMPQEGMTLGFNVFRGINQDIKIQKDDRRRHLYVIGQTGTGKSVFLKNLIRQDIEAGEGVCFIDPHGDTVEEILSYVPKSRAEDVIYFNPADTSRPLGLNMLEYDSRFPEQKTMVVNELFSIFQKLYGAVPESMGPIFEQYFRNSTLLVMDDPASGNTLLEIERVLADADFRELKLSRTSNVVVKTFWEQIAEKAGGESSLANIVPYITSKFDTFLANEIMRPIIVQEKSAFNFREVMDNRKILLINLSKGRLGELNSSLLGLIMVGKLLIAALSRTNTPEEERHDFYLYLDEFQNVTTPSIATILSEARKYRLDMIMSHQYIGQLEENIKKAVFGNVGSMVAFRIGSDDGEFMEKQFSPVFKAQDLLNVDNYNCYIKLLINGQTSEAFSMKTYPPGPGDKSVAEAIKELSRTKYGRVKEEIEEEILKKHNL